MILKRILLSILLMLNIENDHAFEETRSDSNCFCEPVKEICSENRNIKVGLCFGKTAKSEAEFFSGKGFIVKDDKNNFYELNQTKLNVELMSADKEAIILKKRGFLFSRMFIYEKICGTGPCGADFCTLYKKSDKGNYFFSFDTGELYPKIIPSDKIEIIPKTKSFIFNKTPYRGNIILLRKENKFNIINEVGTEDYVNGVMPYEIGTGKPKEAEKAFSILVRTVPLSESKPSHLAQGFDVCDKTCCQIYKGEKIVDEELRNSVSATKGLILKYGKKPATVLYYTSSGGGSGCSVSFAFGGEELPYLPAVNIGEPVPKGKNGIWTEKFTVRQITEKIRAYDESTANIGSIKSISAFSEDKYSSGYINLLRITDCSGKVREIKGCSSVRLALGLRSAKFKVFPNLSEDKTKIIGFTFVGHGFGHGVGLSGTGAEWLCKEKNAGYRDILKAYFPGTQISRIDG